MITRALNVYVLAICLSFSSPFSIPAAHADTLPAAPDPKGSAGVQPPSLIQSNSAAAPGLPSADKGLDDHQARILEFKGEVKVLKHGTEQWIMPEKKMLLESGDQIMTGEDGQVDIAYDNFFLNIARIEKKSKAEFRSIEPTDLYIEDGSIFSALDGLEGKKYQVATATAVAAVRGTHLFTEAQSGSFTEVAVVPDTRTEHESTVFVQDLIRGTEFNVVEGQQLSMGSDGGKVVPIEPQILEQSATAVQSFDGESGNLRKEGIAQLTEVSPSAPADEKKSDEAPAGMKKDDDKKPAGDGNPPSGGDQGGSTTDPSGSGGLPPLKSSDTETVQPQGSSDMDALLETMLSPADPGYTPPQNTDKAGDSKLQDSSGNPSGPKRRSATGVDSTSGDTTRGSSSPSGTSTSNDGTNKPAGTTGPAPVYNDAVARFMGVGVGLSGSAGFNDPTHPSTAANGMQNPAAYMSTVATNLYQNAGYKPEAASYYGTSMGTAFASYYMPLSTAAQMSNNPLNYKPGDPTYGPAAPGTAANYAPGTAPGTASTSTYATAPAGGYPNTPGNYTSTTNGGYTTAPGTAGYTAPGAAGYTPPAGGTYPPTGGYTAPGAAGYTPPAGGTYPPTGGYTAPGAAGYTPPAGGTYPPTGGYTPPGAAGYVPSPSGYMPPGGAGYAPPTSGNFYDPGTAGGGYTPPGASGYMPPGGAGYMPPAGGGNYYDPAMGAAGGYTPPGGYMPSGGAGYVPPTGGNYYDPMTASGGYMPPGGYMPGGGYTTAGGYTPPPDPSTYGGAYVPPGGYAPPPDPSSYAPPGGYAPPPDPNMYVPPPYVPPPDTYVNPDSQSYTYTPPPTTAPCPDPATCPH